ncbi:putative protein phosphatase 2C-like protein 44 [Acorus gramineus]|uniref:protein-serine/threonine phosphatase n=1 Tax=Acorus gramineus TaxID=55184 RepID=A0AAV9APR7_ACOGR|nr:putative protein phosphatase 2C-like protein 44 [Acorus gramineus]
MEAPRETHMAFKIFVPKLKGIKIRRFIPKTILSKQSPLKIGISYGQHAVEKGSHGDPTNTAEREESEAAEVWLFGVSGGPMADRVSTYLQSHLFNNNLSAFQIWRRAKRTMKKAYVSTKPKLNEVEEWEALEEWGWTAMTIVNRKKFVVAEFGGYRAVVCRKGLANYVGKWYWRASRRWSFNGMFKKNSKTPKNSRLRIEEEKINAETEFIMLASDGIWQVMNIQEAVDMVWYLEDPQEAAELLAKEAIIELSSCEKILSVPAKTNKTGLSV